MLLSKFGENVEEASESLLCGLHSFQHHRQVEVT